MAKHSHDILALARRGAQHRYEELITELESLARQFPGLRAGGREAVKPARKARKAASAEAQPKKRRKMSAASRKAISDAQKKRWAKHKNAKA